VRAFLRGAMVRNLFPDALWTGVYKFLLHNIKLKFRQD
jgi:hypothetical protein